MNITYDDIKEYDTKYIYWSTAKDLVGDTLNDLPPGKKKFAKLIKKASQPVPKVQGKSEHPDSYNGKQTRPRKAGDTSG